MRGGDRNIILLDEPDTHTMSHRAWMHERGTTGRRTDGMSVSLPTMMDPVSAPERSDDLASTEPKTMIRIYLAHKQSATGEHAIMDIPTSLADLKAKCEAEFKKKIDKTHTKVEIRLEIFTDAQSFKILCESEEEYLRACAYAIQKGVVVRSVYATFE